jgi:PPK2 family polyphosphate:nucleotide phosphotransferase
MNSEKFKVKKDKKLQLAEIDPSETNDYSSKEAAKNKLDDNIKRLAGLQDMLYAQNQYAVLIILQAMDTAGKDGIIKHVMKGLNPQGTIVRSFKQPSIEELDHDYLWRAVKHLPERGQIGIFNRSYYEEVLVVRVHNLIESQGIPAKNVTARIWKDRFRQIRNFEDYLTENGTVILKFFLHISMEEQKKRLLERIDDKSKNWKFSSADIKERNYWDNYQQCYQEALGETSTKNAPWFVIPSDKKWFARLAVSEIIIKTMEKLDLSYPVLTSEQEAGLQEYRNILSEE